MKGIPNISEIFYNKDGNVYDSIGTFKFKSLSNYQNLLLIHLEDGYVEDEVMLINFTPKNNFMSYTTHWFQLTPILDENEQQIRTYIKDGDDPQEPKYFYTYGISLPKIVLQNNNEKVDVVNTITIIKRFGVRNLGFYDKLDNFKDYINNTLLVEEEKTLEDLMEEKAFAYIYGENEEENNGFYQVEFVDSSFEWVLKTDLANYHDAQLQYSQYDIYVQRGYSNPQGVPSISYTTTQMVMQTLSSIQNQLNTILSGYISDLLTQNTTTLQLEVNRNIMNNHIATISGNVRISNKSKNLLQVIANGVKDGLYITHDDTKTNESDFLGLESRVEDIELNELPPIKQDILDLDGRVGQNETDILDLQTNKAEKSNTYTKTEVNNMISSIPKFEIKVVDELPIIGDEGKFYILRGTDEEYIWINEEERYELLGTLDIDLGDLEFGEITLNDITTEDETPKLITGKMISKIPFDGGTF